MGSWLPGILALGDLSVLVEQAFVDVADGELIGLGDELVHGAVGKRGGDGFVDALHQGIVALHDADRGTGNIIRNVADDDELGIVLGIVLGDSGLDECAVELVVQQIADDVGDLGQGDDVGVRSTSAPRRTDRPCP